jgi:hypothetical protein
MNTKLFRLHYPGLTFLGLLGACSGGGINISVDGPVIPPVPPAQTSEAITAHGVITGLGGVTINGVRYTTNATNVTVNGQPGTLADLDQGLIVTLSGRINSDGQSGTANSIVFDANLIGPAENLDAANGRMTVMGQFVMTDTDTSFGTGIDPLTFAGLAVGDIVQISGYADAAGAIRATRIDPASANAELQLIGKVAGLDLANLLFSINGLIVDYSAAVVIDLPGGAPGNGMMVKAIGTKSGGLFNVERLVSAPDLTGNSGQRVHTAGVITRFNSASDFDINSTPAAVDAGTAYQNGAAGDLALNAEVVIDGDFVSGGRIAANRVTFGRLVNDTATLSFDFKDFTEIYVPTVFNVIVTQGPDFSVEVIVDAEVAARANVTQTGNRLNISLAQGNGNIDRLDAYITMPVLDKIDLTGVANATLNGFDQAQMTVNVGGVSRLQGKAMTISNLTANVSGVSLLNLRETHPIGYANINVSGVSQATLNMAVGSSMTGSVGTGQGTGVSTLFYYGTNVAVNVTTDALSSIVRLGDTRP